MKILHITETIQGGVASYLSDIYTSQIHRYGCDSVKFFIPKGSDSHVKNISKSNLIYFNIQRRSLFGIFRYILLVRQVIQENKPDIIHAHSSFAGLAVRIISIFSHKKPKIVYCAHGWSFLMESPKYLNYLYLFVERFLIKFTDIVVCISKYDRDHAVANDFPASKLMMIHNGIEPNCERLGPVPECFSKASKNILFVGRRDNQKGFDYFVEVARAFDGEDVNFIAIGSSVISDSKKYDFPDNLIDLGWIDRDLLDDYYSNSDLVFIPSRWEGFGLVAIEAMKNSTPVLASNRGALPELVVPGTSGFIFDFQLKSEVISVIRDTSIDDFSQLGESARNYFMTNFTADMMNKKILSVYDELHPE